MHKIKAIVPKPLKSFDDQQVRMAIIEANGAAVREAEVILLKFIASWKKKNVPTFRRNIKVERATITTTAKVFSIQNAGVDHSYIILPKRKRFLRFKPKKGGGKYVFARKVRHPGFKAQNFTGRAAQLMERRYQQLMDESLARLA